jgi:hypothetical protein
MQSLAWASTGRHHAPIDFQIALGYSDIRQRFPLDSGALLHCTSAASKVARWVLGPAREGSDRIALRPANRASRTVWMGRMQQGAPSGIAVGDQDAMPIRIRRPLYERL